MYGIHFHFKYYRLVYTVCTVCAHTRCCLCNFKPMLGIALYTYTHVDKRKLQEYDIPDKVFHV